MADLTAGVAASHQAAPYQTAQPIGRKRVRRRRDLSNEALALGGPGSGNFGHAGRPGEVGGSASDGEVPTTVHRAGSSVQLPGRYDKTKIPTGSIAITSPHGYLTATKSSTDSDYLWVNHIRVADEAQGRGEGTALYKAAVHAAQAQGYKGLLKGDIPGRPVSEAAERMWARFDREGLTESVTTRVGGQEHVTRALVRTTKRHDLGGPGSGNFGHAGRPGEVGGSAPSDGVGPSASTVESVTKHVETVATRLGFDASLVDVVSIEPRRFEVAGRQLREGGHFDPRTGRIEINVQTNLADTPAIQGLVAHEVMHAQDQAVQDQSQSEHDDPALRSLDPRLFRRNGYPRDEKIPELSARWPASATLAKYHPDGDSYLGTWKQTDSGAWVFDEEENRTRADRMEKEDGFTAYSRLYWEEYRANQTAHRGYARQRAIQETLAEVAAYHDRAPRGPWKEGVPSKSWQAYGDAVRTVYPSIPPVKGREKK